ncbi:MAG: hypothetical protein K9M03_02375 [Kiritimatiellales bacterium]|nr:hypothetical protein [Kiritimatiellales bacterium]
MIAFSSPEDNPRVEAEERQKLLAEARHLDAKVTLYTSKMKADEIEKWETGHDLLENAEKNNVSMGREEFRQAVHKAMTAFRNILPTEGFSNLAESSD